MMIEARKRGQFGTFYAVVTRGSRHGVIQHPMEVYGVFNTEAQALDYVAGETSVALEVHPMWGFLEDGFEGRVILAEWVGSYEYDPHYESKAFLEKVIHRRIWERLSPEERAYQEMKALIRRLDTAFREGRFSEVADEMDALDVDAMDPNIVVGWLSFTYPATRQLGEARVSYVSRAKARLESTIGPERTANILSRLG